MKYAKEYTELLNEAKKSVAVWPPVTDRVTTNLDPIFGLPAPSKKYMTPGGWHIKMLGTQTYKDVYDSMTPEQKKHIPAPTEVEPQYEYETDPAKYIREIGLTPLELVDMGYHIRNDLILRASMERDRKRRSRLSKLNESNDGTFRIRYKDLKHGFNTSTKHDSPTNYEVRLKDGTFAKITEIDAENGIVHLSNGTKAVCTYDENIVFYARRIEPLK